jgi:PAS domain S-box-containing protein
MNRNPQKRRGHFSQRQTALFTFRLLLAAICIFSSSAFAYKELEFKQAEKIPAAVHEVKRVFVLNSFNRGYTWTDNMLRGIDDAFAASGLEVETYVTFMDMKRVPRTPQYFQQLRQLIQTGYTGVRFDAILACDNDALDFLRQYRDELFPGVPVVFSSINDFDEDMLDGRKDITGTSENTDYEGTLKLALQLRPATRNIVVVIDDTTTGRAHHSAVEKIRSHFPSNITFTYLSLADMTMEELAQKLSQLNDDSVVLLLQHFVDKNGIAYTVQDSTPLLAQSSSVPVFVVADIRLGLGVLGGHVVSGYAHGKAAAQMVVKILDGADIASIPVLLDSPNEYMFDYNVMRRFGIVESSLPQGSIVINKPVTILDQYRNELMAAFGAFVILCAILIYLLFEIRRRRKSEAALRENQMMLAHILDSVPQSIFWKDRAGVYLGCNENFSRAVGLTDPAQIIGKTDYDLPWPRAEADAYRADDQEVIQKNQPKRHIIEPGRLADGTPIWADTTKTPLTDAADTPYGVLGVYEDITERKQAEEALRNSEAALKQAQCVAHVGSWAWHIKENRLEWSEEMYRIFGYEKATFSGRLDEVLAQAIHPDDRAEVERSNLSVMRDKKPIPMEYRVVHPDQTIRTVWAEAGQLTLDEHGHPAVLTGIVQDITERKKAEEEICQLNASLEQLAALGQLAGGVGHELRNPLGVISNAIYFLKMTQPDANEKIKEYLNIIEKETRISEKIITDLLDFTRVNSRERQPVSIPDLIRQTLERFPAPGNIQVELALPAEMPQAYADPQHIVQILGNLALNAYQAIPHNGKLSIMARVEASSAHRQLLITVCDTGVGISPESIEKIFEPLFTTKTKGIGLGLAVCKRLIEANDGRIEVESEVGKGSTFSIYLPLAKE